MIGHSELGFGNRICTQTCVECQICF
uniref:Uncharacterized protein n=1 Tax=Anguilla anguilla TaxID=7936 RepID=A0A0E9TS67_ANGAN